MSENTLTRAERDFCISAAEAHEIKVWETEALTPHLMNANGWRSFSAVRNMVYRIAPMLGMTTNGDFYLLLKAFCLECHLRGYQNQAPFYMAEGEYEVPRRSPILEAQ